MDVALSLEAAGATKKTTSDKPHWDQLRIQRNFTSTELDKRFCDK
jgi:hypothetical protein